MQDYEESLSFLGTWGPFQRRVFVLLCLTTIPCGYNLQCVNFLLAVPPHHCHIPAHSNLSQDWIQASIPVQVAGQPEKSRCSRYELDLVQNLYVSGNRSSLDLVHNLTSPEVLLSSLKQEGCKDGWTYSTEHYESTVVSEFNLVCSDQWKQPLSSLMYFLGGLVGCFVSGQISDRFGRKPALFGAIATLSIFSSAMAFAPSWPIFTVLLFMMGMGQITCFIVAFVLGSEILFGSTRVLFSSLCMPWTYGLGLILLPVTAYLVRSWRHLSLALAVPGLACIPLWWLIPESPRWLVSRGRFQEAEILLRSMALENRVEAPHVIFPSASVEKATSEKAESLSFLDLLRTANIRHITLILWMMWFSFSVSYFGLSFNMSGLYGNPFINYFLVSVVELPAYAASWLATRSLPRHLSYISFTLLGALALLLIAVTLNSQPALTLILALLGKFGILAGAGVLYVYTGELSPTVIRSTAMNSCAMLGRVGSSVCPYLLQLAVLNQCLPWIVVGSLSLLSVLVSVFLPETFRQPLPDTIQQMALIQRFRWPWASTPPPKDDGKSAKDQTTAPEIICTTCL
ncbi:solute carrier family 22 member 4-like isoform X2 [Sebastes umbrosus]|uniref:solute carrier family 22 member 4-like isoform X2 n=1 Tax=Sebastes umbrosus TaxID=72105 RepID=UPI00189FC8B8|nr:solute carrier family 22 member 4-like isoform X2 [Sebastes umbrosus]